MIPVTLVAFGVAVGPVVAALLVGDAERVPEGARLPWGMGDTAHLGPVTARVDAVPAEPVAVTAEPVADESEPVLAA